MSPQAFFVLAFSCALQRLPALRRRDGRWPHGPVRRVWATCVGNGAGTCPGVWPWLSHLILFASVSSRIKWIKDLFVFHRLVVKKKTESAFICTGLLGPAPCRGHVPQGTPAHCSPSEMSSTSTQGTAHMGATPPPPPGKPGEKREKTPHGVCSSQTLICIRTVSSAEAPRRQKQSRSRGQEGAPGTGSRIFQKQFRTRGAPSAAAGDVPPRVPGLVPPWVSQKSCVLFAVSSLFCRPGTLPQIFRDAK